MKQPRTLATRMLRAVRKAEAEARTDNVQDAGTGFTILKLQRHQPPLATLVNGNRIGATELQAADEIALAGNSVANRAILRAMGLEKIDHGRQGDDDWPAHVAFAVRNYQQWQRVWTRERYLTGNPMLYLIRCAVIEERPISVIAQEIGYGRHLTTRGIICGLRHYAAHAKLVTGIQAQTWIAAAQHVFDRRLTATTA